MAEAISGAPLSGVVPADTTANQTAAQTAAAPSSFHGWTQFQVAVNTTLPQALSQADTIRQATLRLLGNG